jgi:tetratricopeptide (TPR) repeat protein
MKENQDSSKKVLKRLSYWYDNSQFDKIIDNVLKIPEDERDYETSSYLVRAYNNLNKFQSAIKELNSTKEKGKSDPLWHFRLGFAYFNIDKFEDALKEFEFAHKLDRNDQLIKDHLESLKVNLFVGKNFLKDEINT